MAKYTVEYSTNNEAIAQLKLISTKPTTIKSFIGDVLKGAVLLAGFIAVFCGFVILFS